ncbi:MAG TPA: hypothetical protein VMG98_06405 [Verrucomicrobiae bacterium]|nr:hypothetical protein [Verrucomicrobiae bacterium]
MDALAALGAKIPGFPGYGDADARRLSDEQVRAYLGEAMAAIGPRLGSAEPLTERYDATLLRAEFMNHTAFRVYESAKLDDAQTAAMAVADLAVAGLGDAAGAVDAESLDAYLDSVNAALDDRDHLMKTSAPAPT